jgi:hypothetical protein
MSVRGTQKLEVVQAVEHFWLHLKLHCPIQFRLLNLSAGPWLVRGRCNDFRVYEF